MATIPAASGAAPERRGRRVPTVHASIYAPHPGRSWWWIAFVCPHCGSGHFGRAKSEDLVPGVRRARCGRLVRVLAARTYRGREAA